MAAFRVDLSIAGFEKLRQMQDSLSPQALAKARTAGLRYAIKATGPAVSKAITSRYSIPAARVKQDLIRTFIVNDEATLVFSRKPPTLLQYGFKPGRRGGSQPGLGRGLGWGKPKPSGKPATAKILRAGSRINYPNTFMAKGLPFTRTGSGVLKVEHGPSTGSLFLGHSQFGDTIRLEVQQRINQQFITGMQRALDSASRGYGKSL